VSLDERVFVGLGANLGDARAVLAAAVEALAALPGTRCVACSALYRSAPLDAAGPDYFNAVCELRSALEPPALLQALQRIEAAHGRERPYHHAPRTLDLDLLLFGARCIERPELSVPHPRMHQRAFVLQPLAQIAPDIEIPGRGGLAPWLAATADQSIERLPAPTIGP
jgi:2-amino-4-hydroxy-6-hydroxymethyldihydropteridine diphosphokinase